MSNHPHKTEEPPEHQDFSKRSSDNNTADVAGIRSRMPDWSDVLGGRTEVSRFWDAPADNSDVRL